MTTRSTGRWRRSLTSSPAEIWNVIAADAARESPLWAEALRAPNDTEGVAIFSPLAPARYAVGVETIYEGYLLHYGRPRLFAAHDPDVALLLGDYLYAHGLVRVAGLGDVAAVGELAELISLCAHLRAEGRDGDGAAWSGTVALLGRGAPDRERDVLRDGDQDPLLDAARSAAGPTAVERALALHAARVG